MIKVGPQRYRFRMRKLDLFVTFNTVWRSKPHPYWYKRRYPGGTFTIQFPFVEIWSRP